jgi:hypothetical protein
VCFYLFRKVKKRKKKRKNILPDAFLNAEIISSTDIPRPNLTHMCSTDSLQWHLPPCYQYEKDPYYEHQTRCDLEIQVISLLGRIQPTPTNPPKVVCDTA